MPLKRFQMSLGNEKHMVLRWWKVGFIPTSMAPTDMKGGKNEPSHFGRFFPGNSLVRIPKKKRNPFSVQNLTMFQLFEHMISPKKRFTGFVFFQAIWGKCFRQEPFQCQPRSLCLKQVRKCDIFMPLQFASLGLCGKSTDVKSFEILERDTSISRFIFGCHGYCWIHVHCPCICRPLT